MQGEGPQLLLSEAVSRAAKAAGARPLTSPESLSRDLEAPEVQESYRQQVPPLCSRIGMVYWEGLGQVPSSIDGQGFPCGIWEGLAISLGLPPWLVGKVFPKGWSLCFMGS